MEHEVFILFDVNIAGYKRGMMIPYVGAPEGPRHWVDGKHILIDKRICYLVDKNMTPVNSASIQFKGDDFDFYQTLSDEITMPPEIQEKPKSRCLGVTASGRQCQRNATQNGFCVSHIGQGANL